MSGICRNSWMGRCKPLDIFDRCLKRMLAARLIEEADERPGPELDDERRRYYRLTDFGARTLLSPIPYDVVESIQKIFYEERLFVP